MKRVSRIRLRSVVLIVLIIFSFTTIRAQSSHNDVNFFLNRYHDVNVTSSPYGETYVNQSQYDHYGKSNYGVRGGYPIMKNTQGQADIYHSSYCSDSGYSSCFWADFFLGFNHQCITSENTQIGGGVTATLPTGSEDHGNGHFNYGTYAGVRHKLNENVTVAANAGIQRNQKTYWETTTTDHDLESYELKKKKKYETGFYFGGGAIAQVSKKFNAIGEFSLNLNKNNDTLSAALGGDYRVGKKIHIRGMGGILHNLESNQWGWKNAGIFQIGALVNLPTI
jgi:hypothetical protein